MEILTSLKEIILALKAVVDNWLCNKRAYDIELKRNVYEKRKETYCELLGIIEELRETPALVFNSTKFLVPFKKIKKRLNLYASREVINILDPFNRRVLDVSEKYFELFDSVEAQKIKEGRIEHDGITELDLQQEEERYMERNMIDSQCIEEIRVSLFEQIRKELKVK